MGNNFVVNQLSGGVAEILIYGDIYPYENCIRAIDVVTKIKELEKTSTKINVRINSNGGAAYEGIAIFNAIRNCACDIDTYIDGIAASIASVIFFAGNKLYMSQYARLMTHKPSGGAFGLAAELRKTADEIDACEETLNAIYVARTGLTSAEVSEKFLNGKDNYFTAQAALSEKLIDDIYDGEKVEVPATITNTKDVWSIYNKHLQNRISPVENDAPEFMILCNEVYRIEHENGKEKYIRVNAANKDEGKSKYKYSGTVPEELWQSWDSLYESGKIDTIKKENLSLYAAIYFHEFGCDTPDIKGKWPVDYPDYEYFKALLNGTIYPDDSDLIEQAKIGAYPKELFAEWDKNAANNNINAIKNCNFTLYAVLYKDEFGEYPKDTKINAGTGSGDNVKISKTINTELAALYEKALSDFKAAMKEKILSE